VFIGSLFCAAVQVQFSMVDASSMLSPQPQHSSLCGCLLGCKVLPTGCSVSATKSSHWCM
jgi:hypothetical protein